MHAHVVAVHHLVEDVLVEPAPHALGREGEDALGGDGAAQLGEVHEDDARLEVVVRVVHPELVLEIGADGWVVALDLADRVRVARRGERVAGDVDVEEPGDVVVDDEV